jgi:pimeloyl-ACP methyl ester carboxylesterase
MLQDKFLEVEGAKIHYIESGKGEIVMLFHGSSFDARIWEKTETIKAIADLGFRAISVDFPGWGSSEKGDFSSLSEFIGNFIDAMNLKQQKVILLGSSMGAEAVLGYAVKNNKIGGIILIGAVGVQRYESELKNIKDVPTLLVWGAHDNIAPESNAKLITKYVKAEFVNIGNSHACYLDDKKGFNERISEFLNRIRNKPEA